jgi:hypothetical protein
LSKVRIETDGGLCESGDEFSGSIKCREFLDWLRKKFAFEEGLCSVGSVTHIHKILYASISSLLYTIM